MSLIPMVEKESLLPNSLSQPTRKSTGPLKTSLYVLLALICTGTALYSVQPHFFCVGHAGTASADICPQPGVLVPSKNGALWKGLVEETYNSQEFHDRAVNWLGGAVRVP